jgi:hypothetical protein
VCMHVCECTRKRSGFMFVLLNDRKEVKEN